MRTLLASLENAIECKYHHSLLGRKIPPFDLSEKTNRILYGGQHCHCDLSKNTIKSLLRGK